MFFLFGRAKEPKKSQLAFLPQVYLSSDVLGSYIREAALHSCAACLAQSQRRLIFSLFMAHAFYNLNSFGIPRMGFFRYRQSAPAPCSPPLGGSDGGSAARFTAAVKYGGRENWPFGRETRCMSGHPFLAHHKLKWARKEQSVLNVLYAHLSRSKRSGRGIAQGDSERVHYWLTAAQSIPTVNSRHTLRLYL